jgi:two-component system nitrate/nitrite sensor histidine kinase NarX
VQDGNPDTPSSGENDSAMGDDSTQDLATRHQPRYQDVLAAMTRSSGDRVQHSEEALRLLAAIVTSSDDAIMTKDMDDRITSWNPGAERLYGYSAAEMMGQPTRRLVPSERAAEVSHILERLQRGERVDHFETVRLRKDGSQVEVSVSVAPLWDAAGHLVGASAIARDISERKRAERELAARARQHAAMATLRQQAIASTDVSTLMDGAVALVARTLDADLCAILEVLPDGTTLRVRAGVGWTEGLIGQTTMGLDSLAGYTLTASEPVLVADLSAERRFGGQSLLSQHRVVSGASVIMGGRERPVGVLQALTTRPRLFTDDDVNYLRAVANLLATVWVRTAAEEALRASERRYRALFEQSPSGLILYAPNGRLLDANQAVLGILPREQAMGYNVLADQRFVAEGIMDDIQRAFAGEGVRLRPLSVGPPPGAGAPEEQARWVRPFLYPVKDETGAVQEIVAIVEDITEQVQAYRLLERRVAERTQELSTLLEMSHNVASTLELQPLLALTLDQLKTVVDYTAATIAMVEGDYLIPLGYRGQLSRDQVARVRVPIVQAAGYQEMLRRGGPVIVDDLWDDTPLARVYRRGADAPPQHTRSIMHVPLTVKERVIGAVVIEHDAPHSYTPQHATLTQAIANQAAVAIENARLYARAQELAAMEERARLARELHDSVTQMLFSASVIAEVLPRLWARDQADGREHLDDLRVLTRGALAEMRTLLVELRPTALTETELGELLRQLAEAMTGRTRVPVTLTVDGQRALPPDVQIALYRVAQEALNNVARHADARAVALHLRCSPEGVELRIDDDGRGFDAGRVASDHFGLRIMRERAADIGATLTIASAPGQGTHLALCWAGRPVLEDR